MRRITITLEDELAELAEAEVAAGRAPSVSAWVAAAIRAKAQARAELLADLEELEQRDPTPRSVIDDVARVLGIKPAAVARAIKPRGKSAASRRRAG